MTGSAPIAFPILLFLIAPAATVRHLLIDTIARKKSGT